MSIQRLTKPATFCFCLLPLIVFLFFLSSTASGGSPGIAGVAFAGSESVFSKGCGTDANGEPSDNSRCGVTGADPYTGEHATDLASWCGGQVPGMCKPVHACDQNLSSGKFDSHRKYYLLADLNCGPASLALLMASYVDLNLNGHTITGAVFLNGVLRGFHFFNGILNCSIKGPALIGTGLYTYGCLANENNNSKYTPGGGDQILIHHISGQNLYGAAWYMRVTGRFSLPKGELSEFPIRVYNNTFQSVPETTGTRQHAGFYSESEPIEYFNNLGDCSSTGQANACQLLEVYSTQAGSGAYVHNNKLTCGTINIPNGDSCRAILVDGAFHAHVQYNDIYPLNNRAIRLRDAFYAEVDHNFIHQLTSTGGYHGGGIHAGDNDINSGQGQLVPINIHDNTFELAANGQAIHLGGQQGLTSKSDKYVCYRAGCVGAHLFVIENWATNFKYPVTITASAKTITQSGGNFKAGTSVKPGSILSFTGFINPGNNNIFTITAVGPTELKVADPENLLVDETAAAKAGYSGIVEAGLYNPIVVGMLIPEVVFNQTVPTAILEYCGSTGLTVKGPGSVKEMSPPCP